MKRVVIIHRQLGIFVGHSMGLGFWSQLGDAGGQYTAVTFDSEADARGFVSEWSPPTDPNDHAYLPVEAEGEWASIPELHRAGLGQMTVQLLLNLPPAGCG